MRAFASVLSCLLALLAAAPGAPAGASPPTPTSRAEARAVAALHHAQALLTRAKPVASTPSGRDATMALLQVRKRYADLARAGQAAADALLARPTQPTEECGTKPATGQAICVHFTTSGADAVPAGDADGNTFPDYVDTVLATVTHVQSVYVGAGYRAPLSDGTDTATNGGGPEIDIYLQDLGPQGLYGYCTSDADPTTAGYTLPAYCVLDNDYAAAQFPVHTPLQNLQVTAAHEFFHAVQFGYDALDDLWIMEATATWAEDQLYSAINDNRQYLPYGPLGRPGTPLDASGDGADLHEYGTWLFFRYLSEHYPTAQNGMPTIVRQIWERLDAASGAPDDYSLQGVTHVLAAHGTGLGRVLAGFATANRHPSTSYREGAAYPTAPASVLTLRTGHLNPAAQSRTIGHLRWWTFRYQPRKLTAKDWRLRVFLNLADRARGSVVSITVVKRNGSRSTSLVSLSASGGATVNRAFSSSTVSAVEVTLVNASARFSCWHSTQYSCAGTPTDDGLMQRLDVRAYRS